MISVYRSSLSIYIIAVPKILENSQVKTYAGIHFLVADNFTKSEFHQKQFLWVLQSNENFWRLELMDLARAGTDTCPRKWNFLKVLQSGKRDRGCRRYSLGWKRYPRGLGKFDIFHSPIYTKTFWSIIVLHCTFPEVRHLILQIHNGNLHWTNHDLKSES